jgi:hypothetical protein
MRIETNEDNSLDVYLRQSWLSNARDCLEKGRWGMLNEQTQSSDLAAIGTAVHAGAERYCNNPSVDIDDVVDAAVRRWHEQVQAEEIRWGKFNADLGETEVRNLALSWWRNLRHNVEAPRYVEHDFNVLFDTFTFNSTWQQEVRVHLKGTIDLVQFQNMWDWKTSSKKYSWRDKQSDSIQASVYAAVAQQSGWLEYPVHFNFGVLIRGTSDSQVVHVTRDANHTEWLRSQIRSIVTMALSVGTHQQWPTNDTGGLCSDLWCENWANCKGSLLAPVPFPTRKASK